MNSAQISFIVTSWILIVLSALLFLVPTSFASAEGAAWTCLGVGLASHVALLAAILYDRVVEHGPDNPTSEG